MVTLGQRVFEIIRISYTHLPSANSKILASLDQTSTKNYAALCYGVLSSGIITKLTFRNEESVHN